jgi:hypothetical protein
MNSTGTLVHRTGDSVHALTLMAERSLHRTKRTAQGGMILCHVMSSHSVSITGNEVGLVVVSYLLHFEGSSGSATLEQTGLAGMWGPIRREIERERERE